MKKRLFSIIITAVCVMLLAAAAWAGGDDEPLRAVDPIPGPVLIEQISGPAPDCCPDEQHFFPQAMKKRNRFMKERGVSCKKFYEWVDIKGQGKYLKIYLLPGQRLSVNVTFSADKEKRLRIYEDNFVDLYTGDVIKSWDNYFEKPAEAWQYCNCEPVAKILYFIPTKKNGEPKAGAPWKYFSKRKVQIKQLGLNDLIIGFEDSQDNDFDDMVVKINWKRDSCGAGGRGW